ncbi:hypothetical protein ACHAPJ_011422 [Fusarium lateritium]
MGSYLVKLIVLAIALVLGTACVPGTVTATSYHGKQRLKIDLSAAEGLLDGTASGRIVLMFAPKGIDPLKNIDVSSTPNLFFGMNVFDTKKPTFTLSGGTENDTLSGVFGWPVKYLDDIPLGSYRVQAFFNKYEKATRSDGSTVHIHFPCGDGAPPVNGYGSLTTSAIDVRVRGGPQSVRLVFDNVTDAMPFPGKEIGQCAQGNYPDTKTFKHVKIRSRRLSKFWGRDMYVGANVVLPHGYDAHDESRRYPVLYSQSHWPADGGAFGYPEADFKEAWDKGIIPASNSRSSRPTPKMLLVTFRHESPYYDDSYAVNSANLGPWGDAINDELIPYIDKTFNTIAEPYARIQEGGSTGGWISVASVVFRPDLFGTCFASYPDSLDFHKHQDIPLYTGKNAYQRPDGSEIGSIREFKNGKEMIVATVGQENHWELVFGTSSRSSLQWDVWNAVFGAQGLNGYPLEPWDKVTGEIYPEAVQHWKSMDLAEYILSNWDGQRKLGKTLKGRLFIYVGSWDNYYLNEGVQEFQKRITAKGGSGWANVTILPQKMHGGYYQDREIWDYLELVYGWIQNHAPDGPEPLSRGATAPTTRGNDFHEVLERGGRKAALARQAPPLIKGAKFVKAGTAIRASVGYWDPGMALEAQWVVNGKATGRSFAVMRDQTFHRSTKRTGKRHTLQLLVTGRKRGYTVDKRHSNIIIVVY